MKKLKKNKIIRYILDDIKTNYIFYIILLIILLSNVIKFNYYIFAPGGLTPLNDRIIVENSYPEKGSFNLTYVTSRDATIVNLLLSYIIPHWDIVDVNELRIDGESDKDAIKRGQISFAGYGGPYNDILQKWWCYRSGRRILWSERSF